MIFARSTEASVTTERNLYRDVIECMTSGVAAFEAVRDPLSGEIVDFKWILNNAYSSNLAGRTEDTLLGRRLLDELPHFGPSGMFDRYRRVVETGEPDEFVLEYPPNMGHGVFDVRMTKVGDGVVVAYSDITVQFEQRRAYETLANRLALATRTAGIGIWEHWVESSERDWDDTTCRLFGLTPGLGVTTESGLEALHPEDRMRVGTIMRAALAAQPGTAAAAFSMRFRVLWKDGTVRHLQSHGQLVRDRSGSRVLGVVWDVTDEVVAARELDLKRREAEAANIAKTQFLANMSHEIRTPLNGVLGMAAVLAQSSLDERQVRMVGTIQQSGDDLLEILNGILDMARIESGKLELEETTFRLDDLLDAAEALFAPLAMKKGVSFRIETGPEARDFFYSDPTRIRQVLYNLISNALKFTTKGEVVAVVDVTASAEGEGRRDLTMAVRDTGSGISTEKLDRIFQPFTQADGSTTRVFGGTGLGLSIASQLAKLLGGEITVESAQGVGSTFTARFCVQAAEPPAAAKRA
jgi:PAS domain S-box-containing protein